MDARSTSWALEFHSRLTPNPEEHPRVADQAPQFCELVSGGTGGRVAQAGAMLEAGAPP